MLTQTMELNVIKSSIVVPFPIYHELGVLYFSILDRQGSRSEEKEPFKSQHKTKNSLF